MKYVLIEREKDLNPGFRETSERIISESDNLEDLQKEKKKLELKRDNGFNSAKPKSMYIEMMPSYNTYFSWRIEEKNKYM